MVRKEIDLYLPVMRNFGRYYYAFLEVPYYGKYVDVVLTTKKFKLIHAFEMKMYNWKVALKQAAINQLFAQKSYVVLNLSTAKRLKESEVNMFKQLGVGLIAANNKNIELIIKAKGRTHLYWKHYKGVKHLLLEISNKDNTHFLEDILDGSPRARKRTTKFLPIRNHEGKVFI